MRKAIAGAGAASHTKSGSGAVTRGFVRLAGNQPFWSSTVITMANRCVQTRSGCRRRLGAVERTQQIFDSVRVAVLAVRANEFDFVRFVRHFNRLAIRDGKCKIAMLAADDPYSRHGSGIVSRWWLMDRSSLARRVMAYRRPS